ncbi:MAG: SDR family NAD(P)-dependent oxidoreductase [Panacagrimonas sp.]
MRKACALVVGVGDRNGMGAAVSVLAASQGLHVFMVGRTPGKLDPLVHEIANAGGSAAALVADCTVPADMEQVFRTVGSSAEPLHLVVYNAGRNVPSPFLKSDVDLLDAHFKRCAYGGLLVGQGALRMMLEQDDEGGHKGTILYTGASASIRGKPMFAGFSAAKAGLRNMVQSMAREFGPRGVHIAHIVIDGVVDGAIVQELDGGIGRFLLRRKGVDGALKPDQVARSFWMLHQQHRSAWTHELDLRPWKESF